ncbi:MAG: DUF1080 domain-containing protein [Pirellulales bacterium]
MLICRIVCWIVVASMGSSLLAGPPKREGEYVRIFDGNSFEGWEGNLDFFRIEKGAIVAGSLKNRIPRNEFLASLKQYGNFELRFKSKLIGKGNNAGVQFRSQRIENNHEMIGYQCDIGRWSKGHIWGLIYDESRRRKMLTSVDQKKLLKHVNMNGWNEMIVRAKGRHIQIWVNGFLTSDYTEQDQDIPLRGRFGLQIHSGEASECWYRDIELKEL